MIRMTRRERVVGSLERSEADAVPWQIELTGEVARRLAQRLSIKDSHMDEWLGNHCAKISLTTGELSRDGTLFRDEWGVEWDRSGIDRDIGIIREPLLHEPSIAGFRPPPVDEAAVRASLDDWFAAPADRFVFAKIGTLLFERAWSLCGLETFLVYLLTDPDFVRELLALIAERNERLVSIACEYPVDGFYFGDDYGQQGGPIIGPDMWRELFEPHLRKLFSTAHAADAVTALHSCGRIDDLLDDLVDAGLDVYQTVQPEVYDLRELKTRFGDRLAFWGGLSTQRDLPFRPPQEIRRIVRGTIVTLARGGGYIAGPTHRVTPDVPDETIIALVDELRAQA